MVEIPEKIAKHIQPSGLNSKFDYDNLSFPAYITAVKNVLHNVNKTFQQDLTETQIACNLPFEIQPKTKPKIGALLAHGLFDTPFVMRDIGEHLAAQGLLVRSILLPGHGSIPADLLTTSTREWHKAIDYGINSFNNEVEEIYLVGFSTGAALALNDVLEQQRQRPKIAGLIMLCPAMAINTKKSVFLRLYRMFRWLFKEQRWVHRATNPDYTKYTSFPVNSGYLVQRVIFENTLALKQKSCDVPIFIAVSEDDETVKADVTLDFFRSTKNSLNRCVVYSNTISQFADTRIKCVTSAKADENILNMSHIGVPIAPENKHYGRHGDFQELLMEPERTPLDKTEYLGAATPENEKIYRLRRLTYNPFFQDLCTDIDAFIASTRSQLLSTHAPSAIDN